MIVEAVKDGIYIYNAKVVIECSGYYMLLHNCKDIGRGTRDIDYKRRIYIGYLFASGRAIRRNHVAVFPVGSHREIILVNRLNTVKLLLMLYKKAEKPATKYVLKLLMINLSDTNVYNYIFCTGDLYINHFNKPTTKLSSGNYTPMKLGRYIRRILEVPEKDLNSTDLEDLCSDIAAIYCKDINKQFKILSGYSIVDAYRNAVGASSCMTGSRHSKEIKLYAENPDKVRLLVLKHNRARALLWTLDDGSLYVDKVYSIFSKSSIAKYKKWAMSNKASIYYTANGMPCKSKVTLKYPHNDQLPYLDSFRIYKEKPNTTVLIAK